MIVVIGASGFIGAYLASQLVKDGYDVVAIDVCQIGVGYFKEINVPFVHLDITRREEFAKLPQENVAVVVNCACLQPANIHEKECSPDRYITVNVIGTLNILEYCRSVGARLISFNSRRLIKGEYGMYAISERASADCVSYYNHQYGMKNIVFKIPPVYGYGGYGERFKNGELVKTGFQIFIDNAIQGKPLEVWGNIKVGRPIIYVKDVVSAVISAFGSKAQGIWDIWSCKKFTLRQEAKDIIKAFSPSEHKSEIIYCPTKPNGIERTKDLPGFNWSQVSGWKPQYTFGDMLIDYKKESEIGKFNFINQRRRMLDEHIGC